MDSSQSAPPKLLCRAHKFGGSSLADAGRIRHVADLLLADAAAQQVAITSAMHGTTNALIALGESATAGAHQHHRLCRPRRARPADHAGPQRQRLFRGDLRQPVRRR